jgi:hypothetical protein
MLTAFTSRLVSFAALAGLLGCAQGETPTSNTYLSQEQLLDPRTCQSCHPTQYDEWALSNHARAAQDPLFLAMNQRGQREAGIGDFCVKCHAPMAVRTGATTDGLNLASLPSSLQGVTCYFCHSVDAVEGTHNNPLRLASDAVMRGALPEPLATPAHGSGYSALHDRDRLESSSLCGACHDIVNDHGTHLERTFAEWQGSVFSQPVVGNSCGQCHMDQSQELRIAGAGPGAMPRRLHSHLFPAVDLPLEREPEPELRQRRADPAGAGQRGRGA